MGNSSNQQLISYLKILLMCGGLWYYPISKNYFVQKLFDFYSLLARIICIAFWFGLTGEFLRLIIFKYDLSLILSSASVVFNDTKICLKVIIFLKYKTLNLLDEIMEKEKEIWMQQNEEITKFYKSMVRTAKFFLAGMVGSTFMAISLLEVSGVLVYFAIKESNFLNNRTDEAHVMYQTIIPLDKMKETKYYFSTQVMWSYIGLIFNSSTHGILTVLLIYVKTQLVILQIKLRNLIGADVSEFEEVDQESTRITFIKLIGDHQHIIGVVAYLNNHLKYAIMLDFLLSSLDLASVTMGILQTLAARNVLTLLFLLTFLSVLVFQIFILSWNCNEVAIESSAVGDALYQSKWYLLNRETQAMVLLTLLRTKKPLYMTIGAFGPMTTASAVLVLKGAYSYVSLIRG